MRATGTITLSLNEGVQQKIERLINAAVANAADRQSNHWWTNLQMQYGTVTPSQIFRIYRKVLDFHMDASKHPQPQLDDLETYYMDMESSGVDVPEFVWVMTLVTRLSAPWNTTLVQVLLATGTVATITWAETRTCYRVMAYNQ